MGRYSLFNDFMTFNMFFALPWVIWIFGIYWSANNSRIRFHRLFTNMLLKGCCSVPFSRYEKIIKKKRKKKERKKTRRKDKRKKREKFYLFVSFLLFFFSSFFCLSSFHFLPFFLHLCHIFSWCFPDFFSLFQLIEMRKIIHIFTFFSRCVSIFLDWKK